jgi:DNA primase
VTFLEVLQKYGVEYREGGSHHHVTHGFVGLDCPYCSPGHHKFRMGYNLRYGYCTCWVCGGHGTAKVLMELTGLRYKEVKELVEDLERVKIRDEPAKRGVLTLPEGVGDLLPQHLKYLRKRGFDPDEIRKLWKIQGIGRSGDLAWRIFIPVHFRGEVVSWTTRSIADDVKMRYKSAPASCEKYPLKSLLYGEDYARNAVIVCEGPLDVWAIGPGAVCTCGIVWSKEQLAKVGKYPLRVILGDSEPRAQRRAVKMARELMVLSGKTVVVELETGKDAAGADGAEIKELRRKYLR